MKKKLILIFTTFTLLHGKMVRDENKEVVTDTVTKLIWQDNEEAKIVVKNWADANSYCKNLTLGEYGGWRLPTRKELLSIVDYTTHSPAIQKGFKYGGGGLLDGYWSSSFYLVDNDYVWSVDFAEGSISAKHKTDTNPVRCVRQSR